MRKRVTILIDGQNLFYNLKHLGIVERDIRWNAFFQSLLDCNDELIRTYWFRPQRIQDTHYTTLNIRNQIAYVHHPTVANTYKHDKTRVAPTVVTDIETKAAVVENWLKQEKTKFSQIEYNYDQLNLEFGDIEFVKTGVVKVDPYKQQYIGEKGVDISLAVKMLMLSIQQKTDKIILISGDYDYAEAIKFTKDNMTKIHLVKFHKGFPPRNRSVSRDLAVLADKVLDVYETDLKITYKK
jgi:uncharacterized LabA/DUF88 family protein